MSGEAERQQILEASLAAARMNGEGGPRPGTRSAEERAANQSAWVCFDDETSP